MVSATRQLWLAIVMASVACSGPDEGNGGQPQPTSNDPIQARDPADPAGAAELTSQLEETTAPIDVATGAPAVGAEGSLDSQEGLELLPLVAGNDSTDPQENGTPIPGDLKPNATDEPVSLFHFVPFVATAAVAQAEFDLWQKWLDERYLGDPDDDRKQDIDTLLKPAHIVDLTPAYINLIDGLDMADPDDVARAGEITVAWYLAQEKYKQIAIDRGTGDMKAATIAGRTMALKSWVRWWQRTLENETVERYRTRVDELMRRLDKLRRERRGEG